MSKQSSSSTYVHTYIAISKSDFLSAVDLIDSSLASKSSSRDPTPPTTLPLFAKGETQKLALLSPNSRKSRLQNLMSMLSERGMCAPTDDELLKEEEEGEREGEEEVEYEPPPIPPRATSMSLHDDQTRLSEQYSQTLPSDTVDPSSTSQRPSWTHSASESSLDTYTYVPAAVSNKSSQPHTSDNTTSITCTSASHNTSIINSCTCVSNASTHTSNVSICTSNTGICDSNTSVFDSNASIHHSNTATPRRQPSDALSYLGDYFKVGRADSDDSDSSDYFVDVVPPPRRNRYASEPFVHQQVLQWQRERRASSPLPNKPALKKSSPILTKRPGWYNPPKPSITRRYQSEVTFSASLLSQLKESSSGSSCDGGGGDDNDNDNGGGRGLKSGPTNRRRLKQRSRSVEERQGFVTATTPAEQPPWSTAASLSLRLSSVSNNHSVPRQVLLCESDDNTGGTVESKDYSKPFEHLLWRRLGLDDGSALSGSLPDLDRVGGAGGGGGGPHGGGGLEGEGDARGGPGGVRGRTTLTDAPIWTPGSWRTTARGGWGTGGSRRG